MPRTTTDASRLRFDDLCRAFAEAVDRSGLSQTKIAMRGGPSKPVQTALVRGDWTSTRPQQTTDKIDLGFGWPPGTAWRILTDGYASSSLPSVGPSAQASPGAGTFVGAVGERVEGSRTDDDVLRAITAMSAAVDQLLASDRARTQRETARDRDVDARFEALETQQRELSERLAQLEKPHP